MNNANLANYTASQLQHMQQSSTLAPKQPTINSRLEAVVAQVKSISALAFEVGMRLGALQPVPQDKLTQPGIEPHATVHLNELETAVNQLGEDVGRIRTFVG